MSRTLGSPRHQALRLMLTEQRKKAKMTQAQVAKKLARHQSYVSEVEAGQRRLSVVEFLDFAAAIGFDAARQIKKIEAEGPD
jgi:transcriptional regulator with XRE-family HTH domain